MSCLASRIGIGFVVKRCATLRAMATPLPFRLALRRLTRRPVYTTAALFIFTIGTAASAFLFGLYRGLFLRPLPYPDDSRLYTIGAQFRNTPGRDGEFVLSGIDFVRYQQATTTFAVIGAHTPRDLSVVLGTLPEAVTGEAVSASLFTLLAPRLVLGRVFTEAEDRDNSEVAVISERFWRRRLAADPSVIGRAVRIDGRPVEVVGVVEAGFRTLMLDADIWVPLGVVAGREGAANRRNIAVIGRLAGGRTAAEAGAEVTTIARDLAREFPASHAEWGSYIRPLREQYFADRRPVLRVLGVGLGFLLLIGCANLAQLALVDAASRRGDYTLALALGARPGRLVTELVLQNALLACFGALLGILLARLGGAALLRFDHELARQTGGVVFDGVLAVITVAVGLLTAVVASLLPLASLARLRATLRHDARAPDRRQRLVRMSLLSGEIAVAILLLSGGTLAFLGLRRLLREDPGWRADHLLVSQIVLPAARYAAAPDRVAFVDRLLDAVRTGPGVVDAAVTMTRFHVSTDMQTVLMVEGQEAAGDPANVHFRRISPGMFKVAGGRLIAGRDFLSTDGAASPSVGIVSKTLSERTWPGQDAIGKRFRRSVASSVWTTVVGVVDDVNDLGPGHDLLSTVYLPYAQNSAPGVSRSPVTLMVRVQGEVTALSEFVRRTVARLDPDLSIEGPAAATELVARAFDTHRLQAILLAGFSVVSLVLVLAGLVGVTGYTVTERRRELGIRLALGGTPGGVLALVVRQVLIAVGLGAVVAAILAPGVRGAMGRLMPAAMPGLTGLLSGIALVVLAFTVLTAALAARRISRIDPQEAVREG